MKKVLKWSFIFLFSIFFVGIVAGSVFIYRFDLNTYKPRIEQAVFDRTGRKLSLGDIHLKMSWSPTLRIRRISFADAGRVGEKALVAAEEAEVSVAIRPLFDKVVAVENIMLIQPEIYLSVNEEGVKNWGFENPASETENKKPESGNGFMSDVKVSVEKISVSDGVVVYDSPESKMNLQIQQVSLKPEENRVVLDYDLIYNGREVKGTMKGDAIDVLMRNDPYNAEIDVGALNARLKAAFTVTDLSGDRHIEGKLELTSPEGNFDLPALQLKSNVSADRKGVSLGIERSEIGKSVMTGNVAVSLTEKPDIRLNIVAPLIDVPSLTPAKEASAATAKPQNSTEKEKIVSDFLNRFNARLAFSVERLNVNKDFSFDQVGGTAVVKDGILTIKPLSAKTGKGNLKGGAVLNSKGNVVRIETDFRNVILNDFLKDVLKKKGFVFNNVSVARLNGTFSTKGGTYGELFENLKASLQIDRLDFDRNSVGGKADVSFKGKLNIKGKITASLLDIPSLIPAKEESSEKNVPASDASKDDFIPEGELNLDFLNRFDTRIIFDISRLIVNRDLASDKVKGTVEVKNGVLNLKNASFIAGRGTVKGGLSLNAANNAVQINLDGSGIVLPELVKSLKQEGKNFSFKKGGVASVRVALKTKGKSYRDLFENSDGQVLLTVWRSEVHFGLLKYVQGNFLTQLTSVLNVSGKQTDTDLECAVIRADFEKGKMLFPKGIVFDSDQIKLVGDGSVNLADNKIDILIQPLSGNLMKTNATQILASMIKVTGTVTDPSVSVNSKSVIKNAVAFATGGAVFIGAKLLLDADDDPCRTALQGTAFDEMYGETAGVKAGMRRMYRKTSDTLEKAAESVVGTAYEGGKKRDKPLRTRLKKEWTPLIRRRGGFQICSAIKKKSFFILCFAKKTLPYGGDKRCRRSARQASRNTRKAEVGPKLPPRPKKRSPSISPDSTILS